MSDPEFDPASRRNSLIALVVIVLLIVCGWYISDIIAGVSRLQDCVMAGRRNCVIIR